jgi:hypothetical protein
MARAPTTASAASTQKSIASMHSPLSLAVGYNTIVTHGRRSCNNVVAIRARIRFPRCSEARCRPPAFILSLAALVSSHRTWHEQVDEVSYAAKFMGLSETGGRGGVGVI